MLILDAIKNTSFAYEIVHIQLTNLVDIGSESIYQVLNVVNWNNNLS
jgi:hypothetical protein